MSMSKRLSETPSVSSNSSNVIATTIGVGRRANEVLRVIKTWVTPAVAPNLYTSCLAGSLTFGLSYVLSFGFSREWIPKWLRTVVMGLPGLGLVLWHVAYYYNAFIRYYFGERLFSYLLEKHILRNPALREPFYQQLRSMPLMPMPKNHTHATSAELRSSANYYLKNLIRGMGYKPYCVSNAASDHGEDGSRYFYCVKDLKLKFRNDKIGTNSVLLFTDVDYHAPMNEYLKLWRPMILYTLYPTSVAYTGEDYAYKIRDDHVVYHVSGGASYEHRIWDYDNDVISIVDDNWNLLTFDVTMTSLDRDPHRRIITLFPSACVPWPFYTYLNYKDGLSYKVFTQQAGEMRVNFIMDPIRKHLSLSKNDSFSSVELNSTLFDGLKTRLETKRSPPMIADIERLLIAQNVRKKEANQRVDHEDCATQAALLFDIVKSPFVPVKNNVPTYSMPCSYQSVSYLATEDGKENGLMFTHPIVTQPALYPCSSVNNDVSTILGRINGPQLNKPVRPPPRFFNYAREFVDALVPDAIAGTGVPMSYDGVVEMQNRPMQKARSAIAEVTLTPLLTNNLESFQKQEPYNGINYPRNITTCSTQTTITGSTFTVPFKDNVLKGHKWFGPGLTPEETVERLGEICVGENIPSDYSKLDGSIIEFLQMHIVRAPYMRYYKQEYRAELSRVFREIFKQSARTSNGVRYSPRFTTRSGSTWTSDGNSLITTFNAYCAYREMGYSHKVAFDMLEKYVLQYSDDGVSRSIPGYERAIRETSKLLGLDIDIEYNDGNNVPYLGRIFVCPSVMPDSYQNPRRTLPKLHLTSNKNVEIEQAAFNKVGGYLVTDSMTPLISDYCNKVKELSGIHEFKNVTSEEQWKLQNSWVQNDKDAIRSSFLKFMEMTENELREAELIIAAVDSLQGFTPIWDNSDGSQPNKLAAVVEGQIIGPAPVIINSETELLCKTQSNLKPPTKTGSESAGNTSKLPFPSTSGRQRPIKRKVSKISRTGVRSRLTS